MKLILLILLLGLALSVRLVSDVDALESDRMKPLKQLVKDHGYQIEEHKVMTEDGYWLTMFRIPGKIGDDSVGKDVVFLQHGIIDSADTWVMNDVARSPAYILIEEGYDVWMGNTRGNKYSRAHKSLDPDSDLDYWKFSFEEMGEFDYPAMIEFVLKETGKDSLKFIGHSQGTTAMFYGLTSERRQWLADRLDIFVALGPVARLTDCSSTLLQTVAHQKWFIEIVKRFGIHELFQKNYMENQVISAACSIMPKLCDLGISLIADEDPKLDNQKRVGVFMGHYPSGSSFQGLDHFGQIVRAQKFQRFDHGLIQNLKVYGSKSPPEINLDLIPVEMKIAQIVGTGDRLADPSDNHWLHEQLGDRSVFYEEYELGHLSFMLAEDMSYFQDVLDLLRA